MFTKTTELFGNYKIIRLTNKNTGEYFSVIPELGGRVYDICLKSGNTLVNILDNEKDPESMTDERWYRGVILIPFPNRVKGGIYNFLDKNYQLPINMPNEGHAIHGITYDKNFLIVEEESEETDSLTLRYEYNGELSGYPFPCIVSYTFKLSEQEFSCFISVTNNGNETLPLGVGWHPYFSLGVDVDNLLLQIPQVATIEVDEKMIPTGNKNSMNDYSNLTQIHDAGFDTGFEIKQKDGQVITRIHNPINNITLDSWQIAGDKGFNYVQIFTPPGRKSIAIEPMTCPADAFNSKESLVKLSSKDTWSGSFGVRLR